MYVQAQKSQFKTFSCCMLLFCQNADQNNSKTNLLSFFFYIQFICALPIKHEECDKRLDVGLRSEAFLVEKDEDLHHQRCAD